MNMNRRSFLGSTFAAASAAALPGCRCLCCGGKSQVAVQLYSIRTYIGGKKDKSGKVVSQGVGLAQALKDVAAIGYRGVEFAGYYGNDAKTLRAMLADAGLVACGTHVNTNAFGLDTKKWTYDPEVLKRTCDFNMSYGNDLVICPGGGNFPAKDVPLDDFLKRLAEHYNRAAADAAKVGCRIGLHNHMGEFQLKMQDGTSYWDYFFSNTDKAVCMEQDVGWTTCAGEDPCEQYRKYPHRSPTLHAKENGMGKGVKGFNAILGKPGDGAKGVEWDRLFPVTDADGVKWYVVECERHEDSLMAITESFRFLHSKGRC